MRNRYNTASIDILLPEEVIRSRVRRLRRVAQTLREALDQASVKIATLEEAAAHPERVVVDPQEGARD